MGQRVLVFLELVELDPEIFELPLQPELFPGVLERLHTRVIILFKSTL